MLSFASIDPRDLDLIGGGAGNGGDLCTQAMVDHLSGKTASPEGVKACADQGIHLGFTSGKDLPAPSSKQK
jgi:hypothetical protein